MLAFLSRFSMLILIRQFCLCVCKSVCRDMVSNQWRRQVFVSGGAQVWRREKTENNKCMSYRPRQHCILLSMHYCIRPVCHSHTIIKLRYTIV